MAIEIHTGSSPASAPHSVANPDAAPANPEPSVIGFLLLDGFSLPCFTQALAVLKTANMIRPGTVKVHIFSGNSGEVFSDLAIPVRPDTPLTEVRMAGLDLLMICGGLHTARTIAPRLGTLLQKLSKQPVALGGLWNGAWYLGGAGLLDGYRCAIHPEQRIALSERSPNINVTLETGVVDRDRLTAATPLGAYHVMVQWMSRRCGQPLADAIVDLLNYDQSRFHQTGSARQHKLTTPLRKIVKLMEANLEEPLDSDQLADYVNISRRQLQRLFRQQLSTSPQKYPPISQAPHR